MKTELNREAWDRIAFVFGRVLDALPTERGALLEQSCGSDRTVRREVEEMLVAHEGGQSIPQGRHAC